MVRIGQVPETRCAKIGHSLSRVRTAAPLPMTGGMAHARARTRLTGALVAFVAACAPAAAADAAIPPAQVEALDRQGATEIVVRREPGLTAAERADVRADADVDLVRRSTLPDTEVVRADAGRPGRGRRRAQPRPRRRLRRAGHRPVRPDRGPVLRLLWGLENTGQKTFVPGGGGSYYGQGYPDADMDVPEAWTKATGAGVTVGDRRHRRADDAPGPRRPARRPTRARPAPTPSAATSAPTASTTTATATSTTGRAGTSCARTRSSASPRATARPARTTTAAGQPRARHARRRHRRGPGRQQRGHRGCRVRRQDHAAARAGRQRARHRASRSPRRSTTPGKMGVRIVNASLGGPGLDQSQLAAVQAHPNTLYVVAAGNDNINVDGTPVRPVRAAGGQRAVRRRVRRVRPQGLVLQLRRQQRRRLRARHRDPLDLPLARVRSTCRAPRWRARTRPASPRSCSRRAPA